MRGRRDTHGRGGAAALALLLALAAGCGGDEDDDGDEADPTPDPTVTVIEAGPLPNSVATGLNVETDVAYSEVLDCNGTACILPLDVLAPDGGSALPTVVLVPGGLTGFEHRRYLQALAGELAKQGAVVFLPAYRTGPMYDNSLADVRCAITFARSSSPEYGGDPEQVVLVGHSSGSTLVIDLTVSEPPDDSMGCLGDGEAIPDAVVALSEFNSSVSGDAEPGPKLWFVGGEQDSLSTGGEAAAQRLRDQGYDVDHRVLDTTHEGMVDPSATPEVIDVVFEAARYAAKQ